VEWSEKNKGERVSEECSSFSQEPSSKELFPPSFSTSSLTLWVTREDLSHIALKTNNHKSSSVENRYSNNNTDFTISHQKLPIKITVPLNPGLPPSLLNQFKFIDNNHLLYISGLIEDTTSYNIDNDSTNNIKNNDDNNDMSIGNGSINSFTTNPMNQSSSNFNNESQLPPLELFNISVLQALTCSPSLLPI
jgi:hypothetical protein